MIIEIAQPIEIKLDQPNLLIFFKKKYVSCLYFIIRLRVVGETLLSKIHCIVNWLSVMTFCP
jgi:hypothetical protein